MFESYGWPLREETETEAQPFALENLFPRLVVFCLLLSSLSFTPTKRYEEVDGVRKEKERLTTDQSTFPFLSSNS
jgi:hypothetical protein